jgi:hypothetical protein
MPAWRFQNVSKTWLSGGGAMAAACHWIAPRLPRENAEFTMILPYFTMILPYFTVISSYFTVILTYFTVILTYFTVIILHSLILFTLF